ncbi:MAG: peptidoglycan bridge formation glycyltransferase FemA/FemB family protein [Chloroflexi bacterium]|nr:MAG: peptidoglycan bridge formation glycyltransferase FemA/FemB family protein [Chloroflexota bacterium]
MDPLIPSERLAADEAAWDRFVAVHPQGHILQTTPWARLKARYGWQAVRVPLVQGGRPVAGAQVLLRRLPLGLGTLAYIPRGPVADGTDPRLLAPLWEAIEAAVRAHGAFLLLVEPDWPDAPPFETHLRAAGFRPHPETIQPRRTLVMEIGGDEAQVLAAMKSKTRYNIRLAGRKGVVVRPGSREEVATFYRLMEVTGRRDRFGIHSLDYYQAAYDLFVPRGWATLLMAEYQGEPLAGLMAFALGKRAWYFYGASSNRHRNRMPTYLLQWEAIRWARAKGCTLYDLWGVPDEPLERLEAEFTRRSDGLWGVYRFKRGFGGRLVRTVGTWERVYHPLRYTLFTLLQRIRRGRR